MYVHFTFSSDVWRVFGEGMGESVGEGESEGDGMRGCGCG